MTQQRRQRRPSHAQAESGEPLFGELLRQHLDALGVSARTLAARVGASRQTVDGWIHGDGSPFGRGNEDPKLDELVQALYELDEDRIGRTIEEGATGFRRTFTPTTELALRDAAHRHHAPEASAYFGAQIAHLDAEVAALREALSVARGAGLDGPDRWLLDALRSTGSPELYHRVAARHDEGTAAVLRALAGGRPDLVAALVAVARLG